MLRVLFLCTGNSARSQMAEGLLRHLARDRFEASSAGTHPVGLNPIAVDAMNEIGINIAAQRSKSVEGFLGQRFDYVVTVCDRAKESCPTFHGAGAMLHWSFDDPAAAQGTLEDRRAVFRRVRDEIAQQLAWFISTTDQAPKPTAPNRDS